MTLFKMENRRNFGFSAENPTGTKGGGTRAKDCEKLSPCIQIQPGETVTLCDTDGPGMVTHMWFTGYVGHSFILRIYWENNEQPSVEAPRLSSSRTTSASWRPWQTAWRSCMQVRL